MVMTATAETTREVVGLTLVDGDVHTTFASDAQLKQYLPRRWHDYQATFGKWSYDGSTYPKETPNAARTDAWPPSGPPGSDLDFLREQLLDEWGIDLAVTNPLYHSQLNRHPEYSAALCSAINDWQIADWCEP